MNITNPMSRAAARINMALTCRPGPVLAWLFGGAALALDFAAGLAGFRFVALGTLNITFVLNLFLNVLEPRPSVHVSYIYFIVTGNSCQLLRAFFGPKDICPPVTGLLNKALGL
jgi:hypothetical protein